MEAITKRTLAAEAASKWKRQYSNSKGWQTRFCNGSPEDIYNGLLALGDEPDPDAVDKVIGNDSWTSVRCDECEASVDGVIQLGDAPDYESATAFVCLNCLAKAFALANEKL